MSERNTTFTQELRAGFVSWATMSYIVLINPSILCRANEFPK